MTSGPEATPEGDETLWPTGLGGVGADVFRGWVQAGVGLAFIGYATVWGGSLYLFGFGERRWATLTQLAVLVVCAVALYLARGGRSRPAALLVLGSIWLELHADFPLDGLTASALIPFPVLVSGVGMLLGARVGYALAAVSAVTIPLAAFIPWSGRGAGGSGTPEDPYLILVVVASMFAAAGLGHIGLHAFSRVLASARASSHRLAHLIENAPDGLISTDPDHRIASVNPAAETALGARASELLGRPVVEVLRQVFGDPADANRVEALLGSGEGAAGPFRTTAAGEDGARWVEILAGRLDGSAGPAGGQITIRDVSEQQRAWETERSLRSQLEHAQRLEAVGRLAGGVAHEFNNLLTVVGGSAELLLADGTGGNDELVRGILEAKGKGAYLTRQLLAFARKEMVHPVRLSLPSLTREMEPLLRRFVSEKHVFTITGSDDLPEVVADRSQIEQVLVNLVDNARDALEEPGHVVVGMAGPGTTQAWGNLRPWQVPDGFVEFWVEDTGTGMDADTAQRVFEPFFTTKARGQGTGLGLATVHGIVSQNGGELSVYSLPDVGTRVAVRWPIAEGS